MKARRVMFIANGFSLLELMITITIISIICVISVPIYSQHIIYAKRLEAEINLIKLASALEKYYLLNNTYQDVTLEKLRFVETIANSPYFLQIASATQTDYLIKAIPLDNQAQQDTLCASLLLDSDGNKNITGNGHLTECWQ